MKKKLLIMLPELCVGGVEKVLLTLLEGMDRDKYDVTLLLRNPSVWDDLVPNGIQVRYLFKNNPRTSNRQLYRLYKYGLMFAPKAILRSFLQIGGYDLYISFHEPMIYLLRAALGKKIAWIHADYSAVPHIPEINELSNKSGVMSKLVGGARQRIHNECDRIICVAATALAGFEGRFGNDRGNAIYRYNPQDDSKIIAMSKYPIDRKLDADLVFCTVGRFSEQKAYYRLVNIAHQLKQDGYRFLIVMVGDGNTFSTISNSIKERGLEDHFFLTGYEENPYKYMAKSDCIVLSSLHEAFCTVACEAMILEVPLLTTACSGMEEILGDSQAGVIVPNDDTSLYIEMKKVLDDEAHLQHMKNETKKRKNFFSKETTMSEIEGIFDVLLEGK